MVPCLVSGQLQSTQTPSSSISGANKVVSLCCGQTDMVMLLKALLNGNEIELPSYNLLHEFPFSNG